MSFPPLHLIDRLSFSSLTPERLADYALAMVSCQSLSTIGTDAWHRSIEVLCSKKLGELRQEIYDRLKTTPEDTSLIQALDVLDFKFDNEFFTTLPSKEDYSQLSISELIKLYSMDGRWRNIRKEKVLEPVTHIHQWEIINELLQRKEDDNLTYILLLSEYLEAENLSINLKLPYRIGERLKQFTPSEYADDMALIRHIAELSNSATYLARERLIAIADYIQSEFVDKGFSSSHLDLLNAILNTGMPSFNYPKITKALEKATNSLAKANSMSRMALAPVYYTLWSVTLKPTYLNRYAKTVRHCYLALADGKTYSDLGVDPSDSLSLANAITFLDRNRQALQVLNPNYSIDKIIAKYQSTILSI